MTISNGASSDDADDAREYQTRTVLGSADNFWIWTPEKGFDLSHPATPEGPQVERCVHVQCALSPITIDPVKTALVIVDMQNFAMSTALGPEVAAYTKAETALITSAIPAARDCGMQVIWLNWGLTEDDLAQMSPGVFRTFGWSEKPELNGVVGQENGEKAHTFREVRSSQGLGDDLGLVKLADGSTVDGGRIFMRDTWNAALHGPLDRAFKEGQGAARPDYWSHKNRNSGLCPTSTTLMEYLKANDLRTLFFAGLNIDQCVMGTLQDANLNGFDTILLKDGCATSSPSFAQDSAEYNCTRPWGFQCTCDELAKAVEKSWDTAVPRHQPNGFCANHQR